MMMKKLFCLLFCLLLVLPASAETWRVSGVMPALEITAAVVGSQAVGEYSEPAIVQFTLTDGRTGKTLKPVYALTETVWGPEGITYTLDDVNFDGCLDLVLSTAIGASNATYTFYLWDAQERTFVWYGGPEIWNYSLDPAKNAVISYGKSGWAGLLHECRVYVWSKDRRELTLSRSSVWETVTEETYTDTDAGLTVVTTYDNTQLRESYYDHKTGDVTSETYPISRYEEDNGFYDKRMAVESAFLGLNAQ